MEKAEILQNLLDSVPDTLDKRPGSFIYEALAPVAERIAEIDQSIQTAKDQINIENLSGDELTVRVKERTGIPRKEATHSAGTVTLTGTGIINIGDLFETAGGVQFRSTETKNIVSTGNVAISATIAGIIGNVAANTITLFPVTLAGFTAVNNVLPTIDGFEAEPDADLLERYYERIRTPATSGNKAHYLNWAKEISGVGDARVIPLWNGPNTVKVVIIDSDKKPASAAIVNAVQGHIDPGVTGLGEGAAPIGAKATVISAANTNINVSAVITPANGYTLQQATDNIKSSITTYLKNIAFVEPVVSYAKLGAALLSSIGVSDYSGLTVNGGVANITIGNEFVAVLGTVTAI